MGWFCCLMDKPLGDERGKRLSCVYGVALLAWQAFGFRAPVLVSERCVPDRGPCRYQVTGGRPAGVLALKANNDAGLPLGLVDGPNAYRTNLG